MKADELPTVGASMTPVLQSFADRAAYTMRVPVEDGLHITIAAERSAEANRVAATVATVWQAIPLSDREGLACYWHDLAHWYGPPLIEIVEPSEMGDCTLTAFGGVVAKARFGPSDDNVGTVGMEGLHMRLAAPWVHSLDGAGLCSLVAHELGHMMQWAEGLLPESDMSNDEIEDDADRRATGWGMQPQLPPRGEWMHGGAR